MTPLELTAAKGLAAGAVLRRIDLPPVTMTQLVFYCAATRVTDPIHYDRDFARRNGFPDVIVNGSLRIAWLTQALADLVAAPDYVSALGCAHRGPLFVGQAVRIEVLAAGPAAESEDGWQLPCEVLGSCDGKLIDKADGVLTFAGKTGTQ